MTRDELTYAISNPQALIVMSVADVLQLASHIAAQRGVEMLSLKEAAQAYRKSEKTILRKVCAGYIKGSKDGGMWAIESPQARAIRMQSNN